MFDVRARGAALPDGAAPAAREETTRTRVAHRGDGVPQIAPGPGDTYLRSPGCHAGRGVWGCRVRLTSEGGSDDVNPATSRSVAARHDHRRRAGCRGVAN